MFEIFVIAISIYVIKVALDSLREKDKDRNNHQE